MADWCTILNSVLSRRSIIDPLPHYVHLHSEQYAYWLFMLSLDILLGMGPANFALAVYILRNI